MTFRFPYLHILNLKEKEKEQAFSEFGLLVKKKGFMAEELHALLQEKEERLDNWEQAGSLISISEIQQRNYYLEHLDRKINNAEEGLLKLEQELSAKQEEFLDKKKDVRMWHHLREKSFETYLQKEKKAEQDMLDEIATIRHYHQRLSHQA
jgi:flagellar export protein FliJ